MKIFLIIMDNFWNSKDLTPPPINSFKCKSPAIDLNTVISILHNGINTFITPNVLRVESAVMRKVIYRLKLQFRHDKGFKLFEATNRCLNHLFSFNITKDLMFLLDEIPKKYEKDMYLPCKQMLEYVLVRLQGYSQVCGRVVEYAFNAANMMKRRLMVGTQIETCVVLFAVSCRIWQICRHLTTQCCLLFNDLLPLHDKLQITGTKWLPDNYEFPKDLISWLKYDWLLEIPDIMLQLPLELPIYSVLDDEDDEIQYNGQYTRKNNQTVIILDSDDEDDGSLQYLCSLSNKSVKLNKREVRTLESKSVIHIDSESDVEIINYKNSPPKSSEKMDDSDVLIIEPTTDLLNISGITPFDTTNKITTPERAKKDQFPDKKSAHGSLQAQINTELIEIESETEKIDDSDDNTEELVTQTDSSPVKSNKTANKESTNTIQAQINTVLTESESETEKIDDSNDNTKESVTQTDSSPVRSNKTAKKESTKTIQAQINTELVPETNSSEKVSYKLSDEESSDNTEEECDNTLAIESDKENNSDDDDIGEPIVRKIENKPLQQNENWIYANGKIYNIETIKKIEFLVEQENSLREEGLLEHCLFSHIDGDDWNFLSYQIKYLIALVDKTSRKTIYFKIKTMLKDILDEHDTCDSDNLLILPENKNIHKTVLTKKAKISLIDSIKSTKKLQLFLEVENKLRETLISKCIFNKLDNNVWNRLSNHLKGLIVLANSSPLRSMTCIKQAKTKLKKLIKIDADDTLDLKQTPRKKLDKLYNSNSLGTNWNKLSDYFYALLKYKAPSKLSISMKRKLFKKRSTKIKLNKINTNREDSHDNQKIISVNQLNAGTPPKSSKKKSNLKIQQSEKKTKLKNTKNTSTNYEIATTSKTKMDKVIISPKPSSKPKKQNKSKTNNNTILNNLNQQTTKKMPKGQKRKLPEEKKRSKKMKHGH